MHKFTSFEPGASKMEEIENKIGTLIVGGGRPPCWERWGQIFLKTGHAISF